MHLKTKTSINLLVNLQEQEVIFGRTGGVIEAALRTAADWYTGESLEKIDYKEVRGLEGVRSADVKWETLS